MSQASTGACCQRKASIGARGTATMVQSVPDAVFAGPEWLLSSSRCSGTLPGRCRPTSWALCWRGSGEA
eukprot:3524666-Alexandrium_andersonii.AAC.1